jgi:hypothetical protein
MRKIYATILIQTGVLALCSAPMHAATLQFGFGGNAQLSSQSVNFTIYPTETPVPSPGYGSAEISFENDFSTSGLIPGQTGNIQSIALQPGPVTLTGPFLVAGNLELWVTSIRAGKHGALTGIDTPNRAVISFGVDGYMLDSNNPTSKQNFFCTFSLTFSGETVAEVLNSTTLSSYTATVSLTAAPLDL